MPTVEKVSGGRVNVRGIGHFEVGDTASVDVDEAEYLVEERGDFEFVDELETASVSEDDVVDTLEATTTDADDSPDSCERDHGELDAGDACPDCGFVVDLPAPESMDDEPDEADGVEDDAASDSDDSEEAESSENDAADPLEKADVDEAELQEAVDEGRDSGGKDLIEEVADDEGPVRVASYTRSGKCGYFDSETMDDPCARNAGWGRDEDDGPCKTHVDELED